MLNLMALDVADGPEGLPSLWISKYPIQNVFQLRWEHVGHIHGLVGTEGHFQETGESRGETHMVRGRLPPLECWPGLCRSIV